MSEDEPTKAERKDQTYADLNPFKLPKATDKAPPWVRASYGTWEVFRGPVLWVGGLVFIGMIALVVALSAFSLVKGFAAEDPSAAVRNVGLVLAAVVGLPFLIWRTMNLQRQTNIQQESQYTQLYTEAIKQLGAGKRSKEWVKYDPGTKRDEPDPDKWGRTIVPSDEGLELRLGAIYALERIARESRKDHWPIMEVLCAFIRSNPVKAVDVPEIDDELVGEALASALQELRDAVEALPLPPLDIQAVMDVIGRRTPEQIAWEDEDRENKLDRSLNLSGANLQKIVAYRGNFQHANFGVSDCQGANFGESHCQVAWFDLARCQGTLFYGARCRGAYFTGARCQEANFGQARCQGAYFTGARCQGASFNRAHCLRTNFTAARCQGVSFAFARCQGASFGGARCQGADFEWAQIQGIYLLDAELASVKNVTQGQIDVAIGTKNMALPDGMLAPMFWPQGSVEGLLDLHIAILDGEITPPFTREKVKALFPDFYKEEGE
ncbi:MAG: pentapeptide repeat-containing protein [Pseudomonadota bacterium]